MKIITSNKENLQISNTLTFRNSSSDLITSKTIYIISKDELSSIEANIDEKNNNFQFYQFLNDGQQTMLTSFKSKLLADSSTDIIDFQELTSKGITKSSDPVKIIKVQQSGLNIYAIKLFFQPETGGKFHSSFQLKYVLNGENFHQTYRLIGESIELDEKLVVALQNFRHTFNDDYLTAFFESNPKTNSVDYELYNRKIREFLGNIHNLKIMHGSYKNLFDAIKFFGYGDLLDLKEYWTNEHIFKSTSISNYVLNYIDKSLAGFKKTNKMSLVYQINEETGVDEDGLPLYTSIFEATDEILLKMEALKRVLEKDFLHFNSFIVDIIGELQTVIGVELNFLWQNSAIYNTHLTDNLYSDVTWKLDEKLLTIKKYQVKVDRKLYDVVNDEVVDNINVIDYDNTKLFNILKVYDKTDDLSDYEFIKNYYQSSFGIIKVDVQLNKTRYQLFSYKIYNETEVVFESELQPINKFTGEIICGVRQPGKYKISISFVDWYGGHTIVGVNDYFDIKNNKVVMHVLTYSKKTIDRNYENEVRKFTMNSSMHTYDTSKKAVPFQKVFSGYDINTFNQFTNNQNLEISGYMTDDIDHFSTYSRLNELNAVPLSSLLDIPLHNFGSTYMVGLIDLLGDETILGERILKIFDTKLQKYVTYSKLWDASTTNISWLVEVINDLLEREEEVFNDFSYDIQMFGYEENIDDIAEKAMLRIRSKEASYKKRFVEIELLAEDQHYLFTGGVHLHDIFVMNKIFAISSGAIMNPVVGTAKLIIGENELTFDNQSIAGVNHIGRMIDEMNEVIDETLNYFIDETRNLFYISSDVDFTIEHEAFGTISDVVRGKQFDMAYVLGHGAELHFGESFIAEFDDKNLSDMHDINWTLIDEATGKIIATQYSTRFVYIAKRMSTYSILVSYKIDNKEFSNYHRGCFLVR